MLLDTGIDPVRKCAGNGWHRRVEFEKSTWKRWSAAEGFVELSSLANQQLLLEKRNRMKRTGNERKRGRTDLSLLATSSTQRYWVFLVEWRAQSRSAFNKSKIFDSASGELAFFKRRVRSSCYASFIFFFISNLPNMPLNSSMEAIFDPMESAKANENRPQTTGIRFRTGRIKDDAKGSMRTERDRDWTGWNRPQDERDDAVTDDHRRRKRGVWRYSPSLTHALSVRARSDFRYS